MINTAVDGTPAGDSGPSKHCLPNSRPTELAELIGPAILVAALDRWLLADGLWTRDLRPNDRHDKSSDSIDGRPFRASLHACSFRQLSRYIETGGD